MRRMLLTLVAATCAAAVFAPAASAAKFDITSFNVTSLGQSSAFPESCVVNLALFYNGKVSSTAKVRLFWQQYPTGYLEAFYSPIQASGGTVGPAVYRPGIRTGPSSFLVQILDKNSRVIRETGMTETYTTTAETCPAWGNSLGSWTNPKYL